MKNKFYTKSSPNRFNRWMLFTICFLLSLFTISESKAVGLTGTYTIPGSYATLALAITDLNTNGVSGPVIFNVSAAQTAPTGGYIIGGAGTALISGGAATTATNTVTINGIGLPVISSGTQVAGTLNDAIIKLIGADYITLNGLKLVETNVGSTVALNQTRTEFGIALFYAGVLDGSQHNTITNCDIALSKTYANSFGIFSTTRTTSTNPTTVAEISGAAGSNSFNNIYSNSIHNVNMGVCLIGSGAPTAANAMDNGNNIGAVGTGNSITDWGNDAAMSDYPSVGYINAVTATAGIYTNYQYNLNIVGNTLVSANIIQTGIRAVNGICDNYTSDLNLPVDATIQPTGTIFKNINNNTVTVTNTPVLGAGGNNEMIQTAGLTTLATATYSVSNNLVLNCSILGPGAGGIFWRAIRSAAACGTVTMDNNTVRGNVHNGSFCQVQLLRQAGAVTKDVFIRNNKFGNATGPCITFTDSANEAHFGIIDNGGVNVTLHTITGNDFQNTYVENVVSSIADLYIRLATKGSCDVSNNTFTNNVNMKQGTRNDGTTGGIRFFEDVPGSGGHAASTIVKWNNNSIVGTFKNTGNISDFRIYTNSVTAPTAPSSVVQENNNNNFSNITLDTISGFFGWFNTDGLPGFGPKKNAIGNTFSNWNVKSGNLINILRVDNADKTVTTNTISNNTITNITTKDGSIVGISSTVGALNIIGNTISGLSTTGLAIIGINVFTYQKSTVKKNKICNLQASNDIAVVEGIRVNSGINAEISNNRVADLRAPKSSQAQNSVIGINLIADTTASVYNNTVYLSGTSSGALWGTSAFSVITSPSFVLNNNVFVNATTPKGLNLAASITGSATGSTYATSLGATSNRNDYFAPTIYNDGTNTFGSLSNYVTFVNSPVREVNSFSQNPPFLSTACGDANFLKINTAVQTVLEGRGGPIASIVDDFEGDLRNALTPDIGADEFAGTPQPDCSGIPTAGSITGSAAVCSGLGTTLTLAGASQDVGVSYLWKSGLVSGTYPTTLGSSSLQATGSLTATTFYKVTVTCSISGQSSSTLEKQVLVNQNPTVTLTPNSGSICLPGGAPISMTASGSSLTYSWRPVAGLTPASADAATETANPIANTTYIVTGTDVNGCINTASGVISVGNTPVSLAAVATPALICNNATSILNATAGLTVPSYASVYSFAATPGNFVPLTGVDTHQVRTILVDDNSAVVPIGFNFVYEGITYTSASANSNGTLSFTLDFPGFGQAGNFTSGGLGALCAPLWDDLSGKIAGTGLTTGMASYSSVGIAGSRVFTMEWLNWYWDFSTTTPAISFQVKLYEANGKIQFVYRSEAGTPSQAAATVGLGSFVDGNFLSLNNLSASPSVNTVNETNDISAKPVSGQTYTFTPPVPVVTYSWSPSGSLNNAALQSPTATPPNNATTTYTVTVNNTGCSATASVAVTTGQSLATSAATVSPAGTVCSGTTFTVTANSTGGGAPFSYDWSDGFSAPGTYPNAASITASLPAGTYNFSATITDGCSGPATSSVTVIVTQTPSSSITPAGSVPACSATLPLVLTANNIPGSTRQWKRNGVDLLGQTGLTINVSTNGSYTVVTTNNGCSSVSAATVVTVTTNAGAPIAVTPNNVNACFGASTASSFTGNCTATTILSFSPDSTFDAAIPQPTVVFTQGATASMNWTGNNGFMNASTFRIPVAGFPAGSTITNISVTMGLAHTRGGDIEVDLKTPTSSYVEVVYDPSDPTTVFSPGGAAPTSLFTFNLNGTTIPNNGIIPSPGPYLPYNTAGFAGLFGTNPNGAWTISVRDNVNGRGGIADKVTITITATSPTGPVDWYDAAFGGTFLGSYTSFNPKALGFASTAVAGSVKHFYAECNNGGCTSGARQDRTFTVGPNFNDGDACTQDNCDPSNGNITHPPVVIDDGIACTVDACNTLTGVSHTPVNCAVVLNANILLQGYYIVGGSMNALIYNLDQLEAVPNPAITSDMSDYITISAMEVAPPHNLVDAKVDTLRSNGNVNVTFGPAVVANTSYYIKVDHRNSVETWSANPVPFLSTTSYSFSTPNQSYGPNMAEVEPGIWAIYTGEVEKDGAVDISDFLALDPSIQAGDGGYLPGDLNGDGSVDITDFLILDPNVQLGLGANPVP